MDSTQPRMLAKTMAVVAVAQLAAMAHSQMADGVQCTVSYTGAYMSTLNGECSQTQLHNAFRPNSADRTMY